MKDQINHSRSSLASARRSPFFKWSKYNLPPVPTWQSDFDATWVEARNRALRNVLQNGRVYWGHIVQANSLLFRPGADDHPAAIVFSPDTWFDDNVDALATVARELFSQKDVDSPDPELAEFSRVISDEHTALYNAEIPRSKTNGQLVYYTSIVIFRKHLPFGVLSSSHFPYLMLNLEAKVSMMLPSKYWHPKLIDEWR